jgi:hypothetical protein
VQNVYVVDCITSSTGVAGAAKSKYNAVPEILEGKGGLFLRREAFLELYSYEHFNCFGVWNSALHLCQIFKFHSVQIMWQHYQLNCWLMMPLLFLNYLVL